MNAEKHQYKEKNVHKNNKIYQNHRTIMSDVGLGRRLVAYLIDFYLGMLTTGFPIIIANGILNGSTEMRAEVAIFTGYIPYIVGLMSLFFAFLYYVLIPWKLWNGQTVGKRIMHFKIVKINGEQVTKKELFSRQIIGVFLIEGLISANQILREMLSLAFSFNLMTYGGYLFLAISLVSCVFMMFTQSRQMIHDRIAGTTVSMLD